MGAPVHVSSWIPEDDLLLKNSVEAGASLESLAKGAVQFSQKFTVRELQERWHSLLYDPIVSREAAVRMIELERLLPSKLTRVGFSNESRRVSGKRKMESVRSSYRALRKKICNESFNSMDLSLLIEGPDSNNFTLNDSNLGVLHHTFPQAGINDDTVTSFCPPHQRVFQVDPPHPHPHPHLLGENQSHSIDGPVAAEFDHQKEPTVNNGHASGCSAFDKNLIFAPPMMECGSPGHKLELSEVLLWETVETFPDAKPTLPDIKIENADLEELHSSLLDIPNEEEFFLGVEEKDVMRKSYYDGLDSFLLGSPKVANEGRFADADAPESILNSDAGCGPPVCFVVSAPSPSLLLPEMIDGSICCLLNTEHAEIPCNDHVVFPRNKKNSPPKSAVALESVGIPASCNSHCLLGKRFMGNQKASGKSRTSSSADLLGVIAKADAAPDFVASNPKPVTAMEEPAEPGFGSDGFENHHQNRGCCLNGRLDSLGRTQNGQFLSQKVGSESVSPLDMAEDKLFLDCNDDDDDIPYFSDMEAMILDMDLDSDDRDLCSREEVSRYQHKDIKREIMRLEQGAYSYLQRAMASRGAFAILYGRHTKHYIKKKEVLLGRATEDVIVDIDLSMEGRANKISRRQAVMHLGKNGSFILKNLGKHSISVNETEITPGHSIVLRSSCLIEVRGISFIFEINQSYAKQCRENMAN